MTFAIAILLLLPLFGLTSGLQQISTSALFARRAVSFQQQSTCRWSASGDDAVDETSDKSEDQSQPTYDWDEQFKELQSFKAKYGHVNFPPSPSEKLKNKYPMLQRFCHDQRVELKQSRNRNKNPSARRMSLQMFDHNVRCRLLEEIGFGFDPSPIHLLNDPEWYSKYKELVAFRNEHGHFLVPDSPLYSWMVRQRLRHPTKFFLFPGLTEGAITWEEYELLEDIDFPWEGQQMN